MKKTIVSFCFLFIGLTSFAQEIPVPKNYSVIESVSGDLDKDGIKETVVAYNTPKVINDGNDPFDGVLRELRIYKQKDKQWILWKKSEQALYNSKGGGMMGDPFEEMKIENGILHISQSGGSSWKWGHTDKYRYQNGEFMLVGYTAHSGKNCDYWQSVDFNLSTGKMMVKKESEDCKDDDNVEISKTENETIYKKGLKITLQNRRAKNIKVITPKYKHEIYIATTD